MTRATPPASTRSPTARMHRVLAAWHALGLRQQLLVLAAASAALLGLLDAFHLAPAAADRRQMTARIETLERDGARRTAEVARQRAEQDALRAREAAVRAQLAGVEQGLAQVREQRVGPQALRERLRALSTHGGIRLVSLTTTPATPVQLAAGGAGAGAGAGAQGKAPLYRHGLSVTVEGSYADLQAYLASLEGSELGLQWSLVALDAKHWPAVRLDLKLFVLGDQPVWRGS